MKTTFSEIEIGDIVYVYYEPERFQVQILVAVIPTDEAPAWSGKVLGGQGYSLFVSEESFAGFWNIDELFGL